MSGNVLLETSLGQIELELYWDHAPKVCTSSQVLSVSARLMWPPDMRELQGARVARLL